MPLANGGTGGEAQRELVVVLLTVDGTDETDERIRAAWERLGGHRLTVLDAAVFDGQVRPLIGRVQHEAMGVGWLQIGVAALIGVTVGVHRRAGQT